MFLETIPCPICGYNYYKVIFKSKDFRLKISNDFFNVVKCAKCDFIFLNPRPTRNQALNFYPKDFSKKDRSVQFKILEPCFIIAQKSTINLFTKHKRNGKVLDIGCGNGSFILAMHRKGYDVYGIESNPESRRFADKSLEGRILYKEIQDCTFPAKNFDIITMFQSLEHIFDINNLLNEVHRIMKDNGVLYICVPNTDFFESKLFGPYYYNLEVTRHLYFFTKRSINNILSKHGFKMELSIKDSFPEFASTPLSFHHGMWNFLKDRNILNSRILEAVTLIPLTMARLMLRLILFFEDQNLKLLVRKK